MRVPFVSDASIFHHNLPSKEDDEAQREEPGPGGHDVGRGEPEGAEQTPRAARAAERVRREDVEEVGEVPRNGRAGLARHAVVQLAEAQVEEGDVEQHKLRLVLLAEESNLDLHINASSN